jgi:hypothetical protein
VSDLGTLTLGNSQSGLSSNTAITGAEPVLQAIGSANDSTDVHDTANTTHTGVAVFALEDMPGDFGNVDSVSIQLRYALSAEPDLNSWDSLTAQIVESDGSTPLTDEVTIASDITTTTPTNSGAVELTNPNTGADEATWNAALVVLRFSITKAKGGDTIEERVFAAEVTGTYTVGTSDVLFAGTLAAASGAQAAMGVDRSMGGVIAAGSAMNVSLAVHRFFQGAIGAATSLAASITLAVGLGGTLAGVSGLAAAAEVDRAIVAQIDAQSTLAGALTIQGTVNLSGTLAAASGASASLGVERPLAGALAGSSALAAAVDVDREISGSANAVSALSGSLDVSGGSAVTFSGTMASASAAAGALEVERPIGGQADSVSEASGALAVVRGLAGQTASAATFSGAVSVTRAVAGALQSTATLSAEPLAVTRRLSGLMASNSVGSGALLVDGGERIVEMTFDPLVQRSLDVSLARRTAEFSLD